MRADLTDGSSLVAGAAGFAMGALAGMTDGLFGLKGPVPAMLFGLVAAAEAIKLVHTRNPPDLRNLAIGALVGGAAGIIAMALAREPLTHALPLAANYALMGALAGAWFRQARLATLLGTLAGSGLGAGLALVTGHLQAGHTTTAVSGPLAIVLQAALGALTGGMVGAWLRQAAGRAATVGQSSTARTADRVTICRDETCTECQSGDSADSTDPDVDRL